MDAVRRQTTTTDAPDGSTHHAGTRTRRGTPLPFRALDALAAVALAPLLAAWTLLALLLPRRTRPRGRRILVLDTSYSLHTIRSRGQEQAILCRDLGGFFDHVTTVHPLAGADSTDPDETRFGPIRSTRLDDRHTVVENPVHRRRWLRHLQKTSFLVSQWRLLRFLRRHVRRDGTSLIRIGDPYYQGLVGLFLARTRRLRLVIRVGGNLDDVYGQSGQLMYPRILPSRRIEQAVGRFVLKRADLVVGANQDNLDSAVRNGARPERTTLFRYGNLVAPEHFVPPEQRGPARDLPAALAVDAPLLVFVGRLEPVKHVEDLVEVMAQVHREVPEAKLVIVGDGSRRQAMAERAEALGVGDSVVFVGNRGQSWIAALMPRVHVVVASHMGRALVETALGGAPAVAYDHDWHRELVTDGENGVLVPFGDKDAFARAVVDLLRDPERARAMGRRLRESAYDMMHPDRLNEHERGAYQGLLDEVAA